MIKEIGLFKITIALQPEQLKQEAHEWLFLNNMNGIKIEFAIRTKEFNHNSQYQDYYMIINHMIVHTKNNMWENTFRRQ